jgi:CelD/BcsL family acetyltransferase involved in cellulose biosynthesis/GNAT superfamily N-acetyltransferase
MAAIASELIVGEQALSRLGDRGFTGQWRALHAECRHATVYQSPAYCRAWYEAYRSRWQPVLALARDDAGMLTGLWLLAYDAQHGALAHAGAQQAEYQVWLARAGTDVAFLEAAWPALKRRLHFRTLSFRYLPDTRLVEIIRAVRVMRDEVVARVYRRPLLALEPEQFKAFLTKKRNRYRFAQFNKLGKLEFRRIKDEAEFAAAFDEFMLFYDFRHAAMFQGAPFRDDPLKVEFHRKLFRAGDITHLTATFLDGRPVAGCWGSVTGATMHVGMLMHSPFIAKHSPGKFHLMQLSDQLYRDGVRLFDLTPGQDAWKDRLASDYDEVAEAVIYRSGFSALRERAVRAGSRAARRSLAALGIAPAAVLPALRRRVRVATVVSEIGEWLNVSREYRVYCVLRNRASGFTAESRVLRDPLGLLLAYAPSERWQRRADFLGNALARLENGQHCYAVQSDGQIAHYGWLVLHQTTSQVIEVRQDLSFAPGSAVLYDFYTPPKYRGRGFYRAAIATMVCEAFAHSDIERVYIGVLADNGPSRHVIEALGFEYQESLFWSRRLGLERRWASHSPGIPEPRGA